MEVVGGVKRLHAGTTGAALQTRNSQADLLSEPNAFQLT